MKITVADATAARICSRMRAWFRKHDLDWDTACGEGLDYDYLMSIGDQQTMIERAARKARERHERR